MGRLEQAMSEAGIDPASILVFAITHTGAGARDAKASPQSFAVVSFPVR
jgi:hypothetical protein